MRFSQLCSWEWTLLCMSFYRSALESPEIGFLHLSRLISKPAKWLCVQRRRRSAWASAKSDQNLRCVFYGWLRTQAFFKRTVKTLIRLGGCPGWSESLLGTHAISLVLSWGGSFLLCTHEYFCEVLRTYSSTFIKWVLSTYSSSFQAISTQYLLEYWSSVLASCLMVLCKVVKALPWLPLFLFYASMPIIYTVLPYISSLWP